MVHYLFNFIGTQEGTFTRPQQQLSFIVILFITSPSSPTPGVRELAHQSQAKFPHLEALTNDNDNDEVIIIGSRPSVMRNFERPFAHIIWSMEVHHYLLRFDI